MVNGGAEAAVSATGAELFGTQTARTTATVKTANAAVMTNSTRPRPGWVEETSTDNQVPDAGWLSRARYNRANYRAARS